MPEPYSLAGRAWLRVARATGQHEVVRLCEIADPSISHLDTGRPDCDAAISEFLIGLLAVALGPADDEEWLELYSSPPDATALADALTPFADALIVDGEGERFFQDQDSLADGASFPVEALFIDAPADHFMVDARYQALSRAGAAIALLTLQTMAPSGGAGHRTSLRGGGPLTTLVVPRSQPTLWQRLWANVPAGLKAKPNDAARIFPWLVATRTSNSKAGGEMTTPEHVDPAQAFFGMPRRIRLNFEPNREGVRCDLTGEVDEVVARSYVTKPWGTNYPSNTWRHPLSPYYRPKKGEAEMLPVHLQESRVGYRDWLGLVSSAREEARPADIVHAFRETRAWLIGEDRNAVQLQATGYVLDNMKPLDFGESRMPLLTAGSARRNVALDVIARVMIEAANHVARQLVSAVRQALFGQKAKIDSGSTVLSSVNAQFWMETETDFYRIVSEVAGSISAIEEHDLPDQVIAIQQKHVDPWCDVMRKVALGLFDATAPIEDSDPDRIQDAIEARKFLSLMFQGHGPGGKKLFVILALPPPQKPTGKDGGDGGAKS